jgi:hypothetical protein
MIVRTRFSQLGVFTVLAAAVVLLLAALAPAAQADVKWRVDTLSNTTAAPGEEFTYRVQAVNAGDTSADSSVEPIVFSGEVDSGLTVISAESAFFLPFACTVQADGAAFSCTADNFTLGAPGLASFEITMQVKNVAHGGDSLLSDFRIAGGGGAPASTLDPTRIASEPPDFGLDAFDAHADAPSGAAFTQAAGHPDDLTTDFDFNTSTGPGFYKGIAWPREPLRDLHVDLPPGVLGNPSGTPRCTAADLANGVTIDPKSLCSPASQIGTVSIRSNIAPFGAAADPVPLFNMSPPLGAAARFGFNFVNTLVFIDTRLRSSDYGLTSGSVNTSEGIGVAGVSIDVWGDPPSPDNTHARACPGLDQPWLPGVETCASTAPEAAFLRQPTTCAAEREGVPFTVHATSWPGSSDQRSIRSHRTPGYPLPEADWGRPQGPTGCAAIPFDPALSVDTTTDRADSPTGLDLSIGFPQGCWAPFESTVYQSEPICQSDLREAEVKLPQGISINPSAASGRRACSEAQVGYLGNDFPQPNPIRFDEAPAACPDPAKIGTVEIDSPLLGLHDSEGKPVLDQGGNVVPEPIEGSVYLASQGENPFGSLLAIYLVAENPDRGIVIKQAGEITTDPATGRLVTRFTDTPQQPFSDLHVSLFGGPRAALRTPSACGTYSAAATLIPWSGNGALERSDSFQISQGCGRGFDPRITAGTQNPLAGAYSPFSLRLTREDGTQPLGGLRLSLPPGLLAKLNGVAYCPETVLNSISTELGSGAAEAAHPSCPASSLLGTVTVGAGAGPEPFFSQTGRAYWTGPYKGAPVSLAAVVPAVAGPFDLGNVVVRNGFEVDPETARITAVSDPFPTILDGIPLDLRDVRVQLDRPEYTLNPTSCEPMAFDATIASATGQSAQRSQYFQAAGCERLGFKPKLSIALKGKTRRAGHPALRAVLTMPQGGANIASTSVALPRSEFIDNAHFNDVCTRVQYAAGNGGGEQCPPGSIYGYARAYSPILDYYLQGPVYLRSSDNELPDIVASLHGPPSQPLQLDVDGRIDSIHGGIRTTFQTVPDAPVSKFVLEMRGGAKSLLENSTNICKGIHRARALFFAHNGRAAELRPALKASCGAGRRHGHKRYSH